MSLLTAQQAAGDPNATDAETRGRPAVTRHPRRGTGHLPRDTARPPHAPTPGEASPPPCPLVRRRGPACAPRVAVTLPPGRVAVVAAAVVAGPPPRPPGSSRERLPAARPRTPRPPPALTLPGGTPRSRLSRARRAPPARAPPPGDTTASPPPPPSSAEWYGGGKACPAGLCCPKTTWPPRLRHIGRLPFAAILSEGGGGAGVGGHLGRGQGARAAGVPTVFEERRCWARSPDEALKKLQAGVSFSPLLAVPPATLLVTFFQETAASPPCKQRPAVRNITGCQALLVPIHMGQPIDLVRGR